MLISPEYIELNRELHARGGYGVTGQYWAGAVDALAREYAVETVLDYGAGPGTLGQALRARLDAPLGYDLIEYDPAIDGKEEKPARAGLVFCGDVLEHVEPECLLAVLDDIRRIARTVVFLVIATLPAKKILADGRNAHLIVEPPEWWIPKLMQRWEIRNMRIQTGHIAFVGVPK